MSLAQLSLYQMKPNYFNIEVKYSSWFPTTITKRVYGRKSSSTFTKWVTNPSDTSKFKTVRFLLFE